jgi:hypothetical protein
VPTINELNELRAHPEAAYPEYDDIRAAASALGSFVGPAELPGMDRTVCRRGRDWCSRVLGFDFNGLRRISLTEARMLVIADQRGLAPAEPAWLTGRKEESTALRAAQDARRAEARARDQARYAQARAACPVTIEARPNMHGRRYGTGYGSGPLVHAAPVADAVSGRNRQHPAGRALCERPQRAKALKLSDPGDCPVTCGSCLAYMSKVRAA